MMHILDSASESAAQAWFGRRFKEPLTQGAKLLEVPGVKEIEKRRIDISQTSAADMILPNDFRTGVLEKF